MPIIGGGWLYIGQDNIVFWGNVEIPNSGLYDAKQGCFINDASVAYVLKDSGGSTVTTGSMDYVSGSRGVYEGVIEDGTSLTENSTYYLEITATASGDRVGFRRIQYKAIYQGVS